MRRSRKPLCVLLAYREFESLPLRCGRITARASGADPERAAPPSVTGSSNVLTHDLGFFVVRARSPGGPAVSRTYALGFSTRAPR